MAYCATTGSVFRRLLEADEWQVTFDTTDGYVVLNKLGHSQPISFFMGSRLTVRVVRNFCNNAKITEERFDQLLEAVQRAEPSQ